MATAQLGPQLSNSGILAHLRDFEEIAAQEVALEVAYSDWPHGADLDRVREAIMIRHFDRSAPAEDALLQTHSLEWKYYAISQDAIRCEPGEWIDEPDDTAPQFMVVKAACAPALLARLGNFGLALFDGLKIVGPLGCKAMGGDDTSAHGFAVARNMWRAAGVRGGTPTHTTLDVGLWMTMPDNYSFRAVWRDSVLGASVRHLTLMRTWRGVFRAVLSLLALLKLAMERSYSPGGAGYKRARAEFEAIGTSAVGPGAARSRKPITRAATSAARASGR